MSSIVQVKLYKDVEGRSFPVIVKDGLPCCLYLNAYLNSNHRSPFSRARSRLGTSNQSPSFYTRKKYAHELKFLFCFFMHKGIDLVDRVANGSFLSIEEIDHYIRACKFYVDKDADKENVVVSLSDKRIRDAIHATSHSQPEVSAHTFNQRLNRLKAYIEFLYVYHHYDKAETKQQIFTDSQFNKFKLYVSAAISGSRKDNTITKDPFESAIPSDKFLDLLGVIQESSHQNPFKSSKLRNQIIAQLLIETGVRIGAILKLKISDLVDDWNTPRFLLTRTPGDPTDTRRLPAANKTKALSVSISRELMKLIKLYIENVRKNTPNAHKHDFVFISEKGKTIGSPMSYNAINKVIATFGEAIGIELHPHLLRHKWNEIFEENARAQGYSPDQIEDLRKYAMGWAADSKMAALYNAFQLAVKVAEISSKNQSQSLPNLRGCK